MNPFFTNQSTKRTHQNGTAYITQTAIMLREGVFSGSKGPVFYPQLEIRSAAHLWNDKPITIGHPQNARGDFISANQQLPGSDTRIGFLRNARWVDHLEADAWIDLNRTRELNPKLLETIERGQKIEISTGLYHDTINEPGFFRDRPYQMIAINHDPDHLAILTNERGACSLACGCGLNNEAISA